MKANDLFDLINAACCDITFNYHEKQCGIFPTVIDSKPKYDVWCGDDHHVVMDPIGVFEDSLFDNKSLHAICDTLVIDCC